MWTWTWSQAGAVRAVLCVSALAALATHSQAQDIDWSKVRVTAGGEPKRLLQHVQDVEIDDPEYLPSFMGGGSTRIVNGNEAQPHQFPHQVGMLIKDPDGQMFFCGGSLLTPQWVLTAAHCAEPGEVFNVRLGAHMIKENEPSQQRITVDRKASPNDVVVHPGWDAENTVNDIALIRLPKAAELNDYVKLTRIPSVARANVSHWNEQATMSGWGKDSDSAQSISPVLRFVTMRIVSNVYCNFRYFFAIIKDSNICTSGITGQSTCNGDSGGPLIITDADNKITQLGVTSFGIGLGCEKTWPPAFTRISYYLDWIQQVTGGGYQDTSDIPADAGSGTGNSTASSPAAAGPGSRNSLSMFL